MGRVRVNVTPGFLVHPHLTTRGSRFGIECDPKAEFTQVAVFDGRVRLYGNPIDHSERILLDLHGMQSQPASPTGSASSKPTAIPFDEWKFAVSSPRDIVLSPPLPADQAEPTLMYGVAIAPNG